jgi:protein O-mannosyl-transferase
MNLLSQHPRSVAIPSLVAVTVLAYVNSLPNGFHYDDFHGIVQNPAIRDWRNIISYFTNPSTFSLADYVDWRPILQITYALNYSLGELDPHGFHLFNLFCHIASAILLYLIVTETDHLLSGDCPWRMPEAGIVAAAVFAVHPANSEVVNYIWARSALLAAFFYLMAFYCFLRGPLGENKEPNPLWHLACVSSYIFGLATKATVITLPATLVLCEFLFSLSSRSSPIKFFVFEPSRLKKYIPLVTVSIGYIVLRAIILPENFLGQFRSREISSLTYLFSSFRAWVYYLRLFLWPARLLVNFHGFGWSYYLWDYRVLLSLGIIIVILSLAWWIRRSDPLISFFIFWFFIALFPETSFIPFTEPINGYRPYLAYAGLSVLFSILSLKGSLWLWNRMRLAPKKVSSRFLIVYSIAVGIILSVLTVATIRRNLDWRDEFSLWSDVLKKDPTNPRAHMSLGRSFLERENYQRAAEMLGKAVLLSPKDGHGYLLRGYLNLTLDRDDEALEDLTKAVELQPRSAYNFFYRAEAYAKIGQYEKALSDYQRALSLKPIFTDAYFGMGMLHWERKKIAEATEACTKILEIDWHDGRAYTCLGTILMEQKRYSEAAQIYQKGIAHLPDNDELWYRLGFAYNENQMYRDAAAAFAKSSELRQRSGKRS